MLIYYAIACGFAWLVWLQLVLGPDGLRLHRHPVSLPVSACIGTLGPLIGCFVAYRMEEGNWRAVRLLPRTRLRMLWIVAGPLLVLVCDCVIFPALISKGSPAGWRWHPGALLGLGAAMFSYNLLGGPLFEEFGWRGFLQVRLQRVTPPWIAAIATGLMWAAWHLPLFLVAWSSASPLVFAFIVTSLSVVMAFAFNGSGGSVVVAILMHSAFNAAPQLLGDFLGHVPTREHPSAEVLIGLAFAIAAVVVTICTSGRLLADGSRS